MWVAKRGAAAVRLLHVRPPLVVPYHVGADIDALLAAETSVRLHMGEYLALQARRLGQSGDIAVSSELVEGAVVRRILETARATGSDLIAMTTHGSGGLSDAWLGNVADGVMRNARVPVLLVRARPRPPERAEPFIGRVLVPLDGSAQSETVLAPTTALARMAALAVTVLAVVTLPVSVGEPPIMLGGAPDPAEEYRRANDYVQRAEAQLRASGVDAVGIVRVGLHPASVILETASELDAHIVVMATHGRSRLHRLSMGSVSDKVLRSTHVPVLLVRPPADRRTVRPSDRGYSNAGRQARHE